MSQQHLAQCNVQEMGHILLVANVFAPAPTCSVSIASVEQALPSQVRVSFPVHHVALLVLELLVQLGIPRNGALLCLELGPERVGVLDEGDSVKVLRVWDAEALHAVRVPPLLEVALIRARAPIGVVAANLALELEVQPVQLVEPVRDRLAVPAEGQVEGVVDWLLLRFLIFLFVGHLLLRRLRQIPLDLFVRPGLLLLNHGGCVLDRLREQLTQSADVRLQQRRLLRAVG
mmetsp:Transcript_14285/g.30670  ORF Transcript_14285/g.30670 Transcript_14285/m.30670 type:complete len:231 (-) Transcript_14285:952-1644(-)